MNLQTIVTTLKWENNQSPKKRFEKRQQSSAGNNPDLNQGQIFFQVSHLRGTLPTTRIDL